MKACFLCSKCFEYHKNIEVTRLDSFLKDYTHFAECPNTSQAVLIKLEDKK